MKIIIFFISFFCVINLSAKNIQKKVSGFVVVSDEFDANIAKGQYVLEGKVFHVNSNKLIKSFDINLQSGDTYKKEKGIFKLQLQANDDWVYFSKENFQGSYFENYEVKSQHRIKVKIFMNERGKGPEIREEKPVIYAYSNDAIDFEIKLKIKGELTFSYPVLSSDNTWKMKTTNSDMLENVNGKKFPYLFWEAKQNLFVDLGKRNDVLLAQILEKKHVLNFLDSTLTLLNLNDKEKTDFITYWGPRLVQTEFCFVQFLVQEECNQFANYDISPQPTNFNRLFIIYSSFSSNPTGIQVKSQNLIPFKRNDFNLLEWGGVEIDNSIINQNL